MVCGECGIGGSGEYFGDNHAPLGRIDVFYHEALGGKCNAGSILSHTCGKKLGQRPLQTS